MADERRVIVYVGKHQEGLSMNLVGQQIASLGGAEMHSKISNKFHKTDLVINMYPEENPLILDLRRFIAVRKVVIFMAANWKDFPEWYQGAMLVNTFKDLLVVHSLHTLETIKKSANVWFSPAKRRLIEKNLIYIPYGVSDEFTVSKKDPMKWIVPYNRINNALKQMDLHRELTLRFNTMMRGAISTRFILISNKIYTKGNIDLSCYEVLDQGTDRSLYLQRISDVGAFLCTSKTESFGIYYLELLCSGCIGVFLRYSWIEQLLPGYKLTASSKDEALAMMLDVVNNFDKWYDYVVNTIVPFIRKEYDLTRFAKEITSL